MLLLPFLLLPITQAAQEVEFPLVQSLVYFPYGDASMPEQGNIQLRATFQYSNIFMQNYGQTVVNDFEVLSGALGFKYRLTPSLSLEAYARWFTLLGGFLDGGIEGFHKLFGLPDNGRPDLPRDAVHYRYKDAFSYRSGRGGFSPLVLGALYRFYSTPDTASGKMFSLHGRIAAGIPLTKSPGLGSSKPFYTAGLIAGYRHKHLFLELSTYLSSIGKPKWLADESLRGLVLFTRLEARWRRFIGGFNYRTSAFSKGDISHSAYQAYFGYRVLKGLDILLMEDFAPFDTSPDVSLAVRVNIH